MSDIENILMNDILTIIRDNLRILIRNNDSCLFDFKNYCKNNDFKKTPIDQVLLTKFTEDSLYALLNADFLYDFRDIE